MSVTDVLTGDAGSMPVLRGEMRTHEPMSKHTSWRVGGHADNYYVPADLDDLSNLLQGSIHESIYVIGLGSNLLVRDGGLRIGCDGEFAEQAVALEAGDGHRQDPSDDVG